MSTEPSNVGGRGELAVRSALIAVGVVVGLYGLYLLTHYQSFAQVKQVVEWAIIAVVVHDFMIAPATLALGWAATRLLPPSVIGPAAVAFIVIGTVTVSAYPTLHQGHLAKPLNTTLLNRDYSTGWLALVGVVLVLVGVGALVSRWWAGRAGKGAPEPE